eukprot:364809-Chlamydomonas_euryale.AAC.13
MFLQVKVRLTVLQTGSRHCGMCCAAVGIAGLTIPLAWYKKENSPSTPPQLFHHACVNACTLTSHRCASVNARTLTRHQCASVDARTLAGHQCASVNARMLARHQCVSVRACTLAYPPATCMCCKVTLCDTLAAYSSYLRSTNQVVLSGTSKSLRTHLIVFILADYVRTCACMPRLLCVACVASWHTALLPPGFISLERPHKRSGPHTRLHADGFVPSRASRR